jgi:MFS family permease
MKQNPFEVLKFREYTLLWVGQNISRIGSEIQNVAVIWHLYQLTHSPLSVAVIGLCRFIPVLIFSPFAGVIADTHDRKKIILIAQVFMTLFAFLLGLITFLNVDSPILIYILLFASYITWAFDNPTRKAIVPLLVPREYILHAYSLQTTFWQIMGLIGPAIGGFAIVYIGIANIYFLNALSYAAVVIVLFLMKPLDIVVVKKAKISFSSMFDGFRFVKQNTIIWNTMLLDFVATFFGSATTLMPFFAQDILKVGPQGLGILYASPSLGATVAGLGISSLKKVTHQGALILGSIMIYAAAVICFGLSKSFYLSCFFLMFIGAGDMISMVLRNTVRQLLTPDHMRGRMVATNSIFATGGPQLGEIEAGLFATAFGAPISVVVGGAATLVITLLIALKVPRLRKYQGNEHIVI